MDLVAGTLNTCHQAFIQALESHGYERLFIRRMRRGCCLIIGLHGEDHAFVNQFGKQPEYRHAWQIRKWLHERFAIDPKSVPVII